MDDVMTVVVVPEQGQERGGGQVGYDGPRQDSGFDQGSGGLPVLRGDVR